MHFRLCLQQLYVWMDFLRRAARGSVLTLLRRPPFTERGDLIATSLALSASYNLYLENDSMLFVCDEYTFVDIYEMIKYVGA